MRKIIKNKNLVPVTIADLNLDDTPDLNSTDPVTSRGVATAITEAVGGASDALQEQIDDIAEKAGSGYTPKGPASVATLNGLTGQENGWLYTMTDAGTLTDGSLAVTAGDTVAWDATNSVWYKAMDYVTKQYVNLALSNIGMDESLTAAEVDNGTQVNYSDGQVISSTPANFSSKFEVNFPAVLFVSGRIGTDNTMCGIAFYDSNDDFITALKKCDGTPEVFRDYLVVVPKGAKYVRIQGHTNYMPTPVVREITGLFVANNTFYSGKKFSVLGDSISAYTGQIPVGNEPYYTGSNAGVTSYYQMWWKITCDLLDMEPLVINGWSGSCVTDGVRTDTTCASDVSRCQGLDDGVNNPDVIVVAMGVNDYSYDASVGTWNGRSDAASNSTFTEAYAYMLKKIMAKYPKAEILCLAPWFMQRGTDNGTTYTNTLNLCARDYADAARKVCEIMGVKWFDADSIGFNRENYYPTYCVDNPTKPTHPNMEGQKMMGICVARALSNSVSKLL